MVLVVAGAVDVVVSRVLSEVALTGDGSDCVAGSEQATRPTTTTPMISECRTTEP
jgi:hypothetical protein